MCLHESSSSGRYMCFSPKQDPTNHERDHLMCVFMAPLFLVRTATLGPEAVRRTGGEWGGARTVRATAAAVEPGADHGAQGGMGWGWGVWY